MEKCIFSYLMKYPNQIEAFINSFPVIKQAIFLVERKIRQACGTFKMDHEIQNRTS